MHISIMNNIWAKLGSLAVAVLLFGYVQTNRNITRVIQVRVEPVKLPRTMVRAGEQPAYLKVHFSGPRELMNFPVSGFKIHLVNPSPQPDPRVLFKTVLTPEVPRGIKAQFENGVYLNIDRSLRRELPVEPIMKFSLDKNFKPGYYSINPRTIVVEGPQAIVSRMERLTTQPIKVYGSDPDFQAKVVITELPRYVTLAPRQPLEIKFNMRILPKTPLDGDTEKEYLLTNIRPACSNNIFGYEPDLEKEISVRVRLPQSYAPPRSGQFTAVLYCQMFLDEETKEPRPVDHIHLEIVDRFERKYVKILNANFQKVTLNFKKIRAKTIVKTGKNVFIKPRPK